MSTLAYLKLLLILCIYTDLCIIIIRPSNFCPNVNIILEHTYGVATIQLKLDCESVRLTDDLCDVTTV